MLCLMLMSVMFGVGGVDVVHAVCVGGLVDVPDVASVF